MNYPGSKGQSGVWQLIIGQMRPHSVYVEPFFGSGEVFFQKRRASSSILIDASPGPIAKLSVIGSPGVSTIVGDALKILPALKLTLPADSVIYCDPPYLLSTRKGRHYYEHEMSDDDHALLLALLQEMPGDVLLSGYPSELYSSQLQNWRCIQYRTRTRVKTVTECLWCNFAEPQELHDWRFAGKNFRQRLAFKRLASRWLNRLNNMSARKRGYLLDTISQRQTWRGGPESIGQRQLQR